MKGHASNLLKIKKIILKVKGKAYLALISLALISLNSHSGACPVVHNVLPIYHFRT